MPLFVDVLVSLQKVKERYNDTDGAAIGLLAVLMKRQFKMDFSDHKIEVTLKRKRLEMLPPETPIIAKEEYQLTEKSKLLDVVTLHDRNLLEILIFEGIKIRIGNKQSVAALQHLYSDNERDSCKLSIFLSV